MPYLTGFVVTLALIFIYAPLAHKTNLVDTPDHRKHHKGSVPLIGGVAILSGLLIYVLLWEQLDRSTVSYLSAVSILVFVGVIDDYMHHTIWSTLLKVAASVAATSIMIFGGELWVSTLGNLFSAGEIYMPFWPAFMFTQIAIFGIINAINMLDGIDGQASGICLIALSLLFIFTRGSETMHVVTPALIGGISAFMLCNLKLLPFTPKVFLGDAGSMLLGFTLVWVIIETATNQGGGNTGNIKPATALFFVALPLFDMVATTIYRVCNGQSPFRADRNHIHHLLLDKGLSSRQVLVYILLLCFALNITGIFFSQLVVAEVLQLILFFGLYLGYAFWFRRQHVRLPVRLAETKE